MISNTFLSNPTHLRLALALAMAAQACAGDDENAPQDTTAANPQTDSGQPDETTGEAIDLNPLYDCEDPEFAPLMPLAGPGYDPQVGLLEPVQDSYVAHTTQLMVKPDEASQQEFFALVNAVTQQLMRTEGLVAVSTGMEPNCGFARTLGVWRSEEDMYRFAASGAHAEAMGRTAAIAVTGRASHWEVGAAAMPISWETAMAQVAEADPVLYSE